MVQNCTELHRIAHTSENDSGGGNATMARMTTMPPQRVRMEFLHWSTIALVIVAYVLNATHIFATAQGEQGKNVGFHGEPRTLSAQFHAKRDEMVMTQCHVSRHKHPSLTRSPG